MAINEGSSRAVVLVSGGLDSATVLAVARSEGYETYALSFRYGQRHHVELAAATKVATALGASAHVTVPVDLSALGGSALTGATPVPKHDDVRDLEEGIPATYVPARNTVFLAIALGWCEVIGADHIFVGVNAVDYSGYPDCRPEFIHAFETLANIATKAAVEEGRRVRVRAPLINLTKREIIELGLRLGVDYGLTHSCYDPDDIGRSCGKCDSCLIRLDGFRAAGRSDPVQYQSAVTA